MAQCRAQDLPMAQPEGQPRAAGGSPYDWLTTAARREAPMLRLFAFPHAGGGSHSYAKWPEQLPSSIELVAEANNFGGRKRIDV